MLNAAGHFFGWVKRDGTTPPPRISMLPAVVDIAARRRARSARAIGSAATLPSLLGRMGPLEVRLATSASDLRRAQRLRYNVFFEEMAATPHATHRLLGRDIDAFDALCDHLVVFDTSVKEPGPFGRPRAKMVGTYRLLRGEVAQAARRRFYTADEFDIAPLMARHPGLRFLELGRSCVLPDYRNKRSVELLWHGIWTYVLHHRIDAMFGCASLPGTDPDALALPLTFLARNARAEGEWSAAARADRHVAMDRIAGPLDAKAALKTLPPLLKGYLRLGARFGDGAVIDHRFGTTDVLTILPRSAIDERYISHFGEQADRYAA